jgi:hypothetical protein
LRVNGNIEDALRRVKIESLKINLGRSRINTNALSWVRNGATILLDLATMESVGLTSRQLIKSWDLL